MKTTYQTTVLGFGHHAAIRKEFARQVGEAKAEDTRQRRIEKIIGQLS